MIEDGIIGLLSQSCLSIFLRVMTSFMLNFGLDSTRTGRVSKSPTDPALRQRCLEYLVGVVMVKSMVRFPMVISALSYCGITRLTSMAFVMHWPSEAGPTVIITSLLPLTSRM